MTTPTPRTDAVYPPELIDREYARQGDSYGWGTLHAMRELARQLERDLAAREAELATARAGTPHSKMVDRFLGWQLPKDFAPDCGISFDGRKDDEWNKNKTWPIGTNLFTADQALAMFRHCVPSTGGAASGSNHENLASERGLTTPAVAPQDCSNPHQLQRERDEAREAELAAMKEKVESLERAYASVMQAVDECGSYRP